MATRNTTELRRRRLGAHGPEVAELGLGCMGMSEFYEPAQMDDAESIRVIHRYLDAGGNFLDSFETRQSFGMARWDLVGKDGFIDVRRSDFVRNPDEGQQFAIKGAQPRSQLV